jgi:hypothetical protein
MECFTFHVIHVGIEFLSLNESVIVKSQPLLDFKGVLFYVIYYYSFSIFFFIHNVEYILVKVVKGDDVMVVVLRFIYYSLVHIIMCR